MKRQIAESDTILVWEHLCKKSPYDLRNQQ